MELKDGNEGEDDFFRMQQESFRQFLKKASANSFEAYIRAGAGGVLPARYVDVRRAEVGKETESREASETSSPGSGNQGKPLKIRRSERHEGQKEESLRIRLAYGNYGLGHELESTDGRGMERISEEGLCNSEFSGGSRSHGGGTEGDSLLSNKYLLRWTLLIILTAFWAGFFLALRNH